MTDNGREFCGKPHSHPCELFLALEGIEHRTTKIRSPRTNGFVERMNRTLLDECFRIHGRKTWYVEVREIQRDLDRFLEFYNLKRSHQGYRLRGRTPAQALREALGLEELPALTPLAEKEGREWDARELEGRPEERPRLDGEAVPTNESARSADDTSGDQITTEETHAA